MQYESTFNAIDNILRNEAGCSTELDYIEQTSWLLFLKYLDDLERERVDKAMLSGKAPRYRAFRGIEAVEDAYRQSERAMSDDAVISFMLDRISI